MLPWLKTILGNFYSTAIDDMICREIGDKFVSKKDFNRKNLECKKLKSVIYEQSLMIHNLRSISEAAYQRQPAVIENTQTDKSGYEG